MNVIELKKLICDAFANVEPPPHWCITGSNEGAEPASLIREFEHIPEWSTLSSGFLDQTPDGYGSALSFFSDEAFRYYLPAFLLADLNGDLERVDPVFNLTHGLDDSGNQKISPRRYGERTSADYARYRFSVFTAEQALAIAEYLQHRALTDDFAAPSIRQAVDGYWSLRAAKDG